MVTGRVAIFVLLVMYGDQNVKFFRKRLENVNSQKKPEPFYFKSTSTHAISFFFDSRLA